MLSLSTTFVEPVSTEIDDSLTSPAKIIWGKRLFDVIISGIVVIFFLSWLIPILGLMIRLTSPGPILFIQLRTGRNGRPFRCLKFRTMTYEKDAQFRQATKYDARVTRIGQFLRKTNLDEMPQFINVLLGDMSVVGPRPHALQHDAEYWNTLPGYQSRYRVKPGITGMAQICGSRGETETILKMKQRVTYDLFYIRRRSIGLDCKICWKTVHKTLIGDHKAW